MAGWIESGRLIYVILGLTGFEVLGIFGLSRARLGRLTMRQVLPNVLAGDFLLLAWLADLRGLGSGVVAGCLAGALVSHATDLMLRWRTG